MISCDYVRHLARYNQWMNDKLYAVAGTLPQAALDEARGAFFGSISGTLNHLLVADTIWLKRLATHPAGFASLKPLHQQAMPARLDLPLVDGFAAQQQRRRQLDALIVQWSLELAPAALAQVLDYHNMRGEAQSRPLPEVLVHLFNHQTHHRGQLTTLLSQIGLDVGVTDLIAMPAA
ncbi:DinB family protein [Vogesella indigofera]|uniref:DinB family protein n=1 Tax=Vogesella indigofera TaxID=45465 RepID=UPI00234EFB9D|nr:DinB family protein [Vogesella indigofera]MDC7700942.1 DinB family protein [Vogesella indigofera]